MKEREIFKKNQYFLPPSTFVDLSLFSYNTLFLWIIIITSVRGGYLLEFSKCCHAQPYKRMGLVTVSLMVVNGYNRTNQPHC